LQLKTKLERLEKNSLAMQEIEAEEKLAPLRKFVKEQGEKVRELKANKGGVEEIQRAVAELKLRKKALENKEKELLPKDNFNRDLLEDVVKRRKIYNQSYELYGGVSGLYDFGPVGCKLKNNIISIWKQHFVDNEDMLEVECPSLTPENVLSASGHIAKFADYMVKDEKTGAYYRADHLLEDFLTKKIQDKKVKEEEKEKCRALLKQIDNLDLEGLRKNMSELNVKAPLSNNDITEPALFNLMFKSSIGPGTESPAYFRPETAQGIFLNFKRLLEFNEGKLPFASAQIGIAYRNEISPRQGLLRVREFQMAEIEHFMDPENKNHPGFDSIKDEKLLLFTKESQTGGEKPQYISVGEAVEKGILNNETLGYFMARIKLFCLKIGIDPTKMKFRQHMENEMAHYAKDCWDLECLTSHGWVECIGCADRSCFDLQCHAAASKVSLHAERPLSEPRQEDTCEVATNKKVVGKTFKRQAGKVTGALENLSEEEVKQMEAAFGRGEAFDCQLEDHSTVQVTSDMVTVKRGTKTVHVEKYLPHVIEPSFGLGRLMYAVLEHNFRARELDERRTFFSFPATVAPYKVSLLPLSNKEELLPYIEAIRKQLVELGVTNKVDKSSASVGKRYARTDEIGIPFGITVDFDTVKFNTATLRNRDDLYQIRAKVDQLPGIVADLVNGKVDWARVKGEYPEHTGQSAD